MLEVVQTLVNEGKRVEICRDDNPESPNEWGDEDLFLCGYHRDFTTGPEGWKEVLQECVGKVMEGVDPTEVHDTHVIFPLRAYIHSGVALSLGAGGYPFNDQWDSCWVGAVVVKKDPEEFGGRPFVDVAQGLVNEWNQFLSGDVYGLQFYEQVHDPKSGEATAQFAEVDSCWGFYGIDYARSEARGWLDLPAKEG